MDNVRAIFDRQPLAEALRLVGKIQPWRRAVPQFDRDGKPIPPKMLPGVVRIEVDTEAARLTVANFDMALTAEVPCNGTPGTIILPLTALSAFVEKGSGSMVELSAEGHSVAIVCGRTRASTHAEAQDAPPQPYAIKAEPLIVATDVMRRGLVSTEPAAKDDAKRPWLGGVYVHDSATGPAFAAMDSFRLHSKTIDGTAIGAQAILPRAAVRTLLSLLPEDGEVAMRLDKQGAAFAWGGVSYRCKLIDAQYPRFDQQLKVGTDRVLRTNAAAMLGDLELIACVADAKLLEIRLDLGEECTASASRNVYGGHDSGAILLDATFTGEPVTVGFQLRLVADALHLFGEYEIEWRLGGPFDPTVISSPHVPGTEAMVSPLLPAGADQRVAA